MRSFFALLAWLFPRPFRERFGAELVERAVADVEHARREGFPSGFLELVATSTDLIRAAVMERIRPTRILGSHRQHEDEGLGMMTREWLRELHQAGRTLARSPGFLLAAVGTLALALGVNAGIFSVVDAVLVRPLPFDEPDRLVTIAASAPGSDLPEEFGVSAEFLIQYREEADQLDGVALFNAFTATLRYRDRTERVLMSWPSRSLFEVLGVQPELGRLPTPEDGDGVVVLSHAAWVGWFGGDPGVLGQSPFVIDGPRTVIGVMPPEFSFPSSGPLLWVPREEFDAEGIQPGRFGLSLVGRMAPGADHESLARQLGALARRLPERFGGSPRYAALIEQHVPVVRSLEEEMLGPVAGALWVLMGAVLVVFVIACTNVANLFSVRASARGRELAVRRVLGAGRARLVRSLMSEAAVVSVLAGALSLGLAAVVLPIFLRMAPDTLPRLAEVHLSGTTLIFTAAATACAALLCGLVPAVGASKVRLGRLRDGGRGSTPGRHWRRDGLVIAQTALALVLLIGSGLLVRSFAELRSVDPGYDTEDIFTFQFAPEQSHLQDGPSWARFHMGFLERLEALPGVRSAGIVENVPLDEGLRGVRWNTEETVSDPDAAKTVQVTFTGGDYFGTMGIEVLLGRALDERDLVNHGNVVVSQTTADLLWPGLNPIGRRLQSADVEGWHTVVGVVEDVLQYSFRDEPEPMIYLPLAGPTPDAWALPSPGYVVATREAATIAPRIRELVHEVAPEAPMYRTYTMAGLADASMARLSFTMLTLGMAAGLALLLGAIGLYGVLSYVVAQRSQEIGVRMALGARAGQVRRMVVGQGTRVVTLGVIPGLVAAALATRALGSLLFGVGTVDVATFVGTTLAMLLVGVVASYLPARRASSVDPVRSMRAT